MLKDAIAKGVSRTNLSAEECEAVMGEIMRGEATPAQIGSFLTALRMKGEAVARVLSDGRLREQMVVKGLAQASKFSWHRAAEESWRVYQKLGAVQ